MGSRRSSMKRYFRQQRLHIESTLLPWFRRLQSQALAADPAHGSRALLRARPEDVLEMLKAPAHEGAIEGAGGRLIVTLPPFPLASARKRSIRLNECTV